MRDGKAAVIMVLVARLPPLFKYRMCLKSGHFPSAALAKEVRMWETKELLISGHLSCCCPHLQPVNAHALSVFPPLPPPPPTPPPP
uniref:Secreted protein n=1 Tax=Mesocestoides corti TaxID=53468 RepID=A0A5K3G5J0_MESCO